MKKHFILLIIIILCFKLNPVLAQNNPANITADTLLAREYYKKAKKLEDLIKFDSAIFCFKKAAIIYKKAEQWNYYSKVLIEIGNVYLTKGIFDSAGTYADEVEETLNTNFNKSNITYADVYLLKGSIGSAKGDFDKSDEYINEGIELRSKLKGKMDTGLVNYYIVLGLNNYFKGNYKRSLYFYQKALKYNNLKKNKSKEGIAFQLMGLVYLDMGEVKNAENFINKALLINQQIFDTLDPQIGDTYFILSEYYLSKGICDEAKTCINKVEKIYISSLGKKYYKLGRLYALKAKVYGIEKNDYKTIDFYNKSIQILSECVNCDHPYILKSYNGIGNCCVFMGEYFKAKYYLEKGILLSKQNRIKIFLYINIANAYDGLNDSVKAESYFNKAILLAKKSPNIIDLGVCYSEYGSYCQKHNNAKAIKLYKAAYKINKSNYGTKNPYVSKHLFYIGRHFELKNDLKNALKYYQKALISIVVGFNNRNYYKNPIPENNLSESRLLGILSCKANSLYKYYLTTHNIKDIDASCKTYELAVELVNNMRMEFSANESKLYFLGDIINIYSEAIKTSLLLYDLTNNNIYKEKALNYSEQSKSAVLWDAMQNVDALRLANVPDSLKNKEKEIKNTITLYQKNIFQEKGQSKPDSIKVNLLEGELFDFNQTHEKLMNSIENKYPLYSELKYQQKEISVSDIQKNLSNNEALIEYSMSDSVLYVFTLTDTSYNISEIKIDSSFKELIRKYCVSIKMMDSPNKVIKNSNLLYSYLIKPIESYIANKSKLIIIPDDYLYYIPFETLVKDNKYDTTASDYSTFHYLVNDYDISYNYSAALMLNSTFAKQEKKARNTSASFIGFAPVFSDSSGRIIASNINLVDSSNEQLALRTVTIDGKRFKELPYTKEEVSSIVKLFEEYNKPAKGFLYNEANKRNFTDSIQNFKYVHIATHGFVNDEDPSFSGLVFAPTNDTVSVVSDDERTRINGILYTNEMYNLRLDADLVVLSACETGLGKLMKGEGMMAMARGFYCSGSQNIMYSLWKVSDKHTKDLMIDFYSNVLRQSDYSNALSQAKREMIKHPLTAHPKLWSGFILVGK